METLTLTRKLRFILSLAISVFKNEPIKRWRLLDNGKYMCDGDCGRWSMHGVCTCGLCHFFKIEAGGHDKIERDHVSWRREGDTNYHMMYIPRTEFCDHGVHLNSEVRCSTCKEEMDRIIMSFNTERNSQS